MPPARPATKRFLVQGGLFATIAAVAFLVSLLLGGTSAYIASSATAGLRDTLDSSAATDAGVRTQIRLADDAAAQSAAVESVIDRTFASVPVNLDRTVQSSPTDAVLGESPVSVVFGSDAAIEQRASLDSGEWPESGGQPVEATVHALAAESFGITLGDELLIGEDGSAVVIVGTWLPLDGNAHYWFGDPLVTDGEDDSAAGPFLIDEADFASLPINPFARWSVLLDASRLTASDLTAAASAVAALEDAVREESGLASSGFIFDGELGSTLDSLERSADAIRGVIPVPTVLIGVIGFVAIVQLARLLAASRSRETELLRARGASVSQLTRQSAIEAVVVAVLPSAGGVAAALAIIHAVSAGSSSWHDAAIIAIAVAIVVILCLVVVSWSEAIRANSRDKPRESGRGTRAATVAALIFAIAAAAVSLWQFRLYGTPIVSNASGERVVDPVAVLAPSLSLLAWAMVSLAVFAPLALIVERTSSHSRKFESVLAARQVARRLQLFAVPVLLTALAVGGTTVAAAYAQTWTALSESAGQLRNGSDVRVITAGSSSAGSPATLNSAAAYVGVDGVAAAAPVLVTGVESAEKQISLLAIDGASAASVMSTVGGSLDPGRLGTHIEGAAGVVLPEDATELAIQFSTDVRSAVPTVPGQGQTALTAWLSDAQGALTKVPLEASEAPEGILGSAAIPVGIQPWSLLAVDVAIQTGAGDAEYAFSLLGITASAGSGDEALDTELEHGWTVPPVLDQVEIAGSGWTAEAASTGSAPGFVAQLAGDNQPKTLRLMPATASGEPDPIPAVLSTALQRELAPEKGDTLSLQLSGTGRSVDVEVVGSIAMLPGSDLAFGVATDLGLVNDQLLRTSSTIPRATQLWLKTDVASDVAVASATIAGRGAEVTTLESGSGSALLAAAVVGLWVGAAGSLVLAAAAIAAVVGSLSGARRGELAVLRVLGLSSRQQASGRRRELFLVAGFAGVLGLIGGILVSVLVVPDLARSAVLDAPAGLPAPVQFAVVPLVVMLAAFASAIALIGVAYGLRVERQAQNASPREDAL